MQIKSLQTTLTFKSTIAQNTKCMTLQYSIQIQKKLSITITSQI